MMRFGKNNKRTCYVALIFVFLTFCFYSEHVKNTFVRNTSDDGWVNTVEMLREIRPLIRQLDFKEKVDVSKYFFWPTPSNPKSLEDVTDPKQTTYKIRHADHVYTDGHKHVGETLVVQITARNGRGEQKAFGGDYFRVLLISPDSRSSIMGSIQDHDDGSYTVTVPLTFPGKATLHVTLIHSSEAVDLLRRVTATRGSPGLVFHGIFQDGASKDLKECNAWFPVMGNSTRDELQRGYCDFSHTKTGEPWFCEKPKHIDCSTLQSYKVSRTHDAARVLERSNLFIAGVNLRVQVGKEMMLRILEKASSKTTPSRRCTLQEAGPTPPKPGGYFLNNKWNSLHCNIKHFASPTKQAACLKNKRIVILGDSTIRQWYSYLVSEQLAWFKASWKKFFPHFKFSSGLLAVEKIITPTLWEPREAFDEINNVTIQFSAHGPPLQNGGTPYSMPYIADRIDMISGGSDTVVAITIGTHMLLYDPSFFVRRLLNIQEAIKRLLARAPKTLVLFKGFNVYYMDDMEQNQCCLFDWLSFRLDNIARNMFKEIKGVIYLDMWDLSASHYSIPSGLHTQPQVVENEAGLFLSFVCPNQTN